MNTAERKLEWIKAAIASGRTVYLATCTRVTKIDAKHLPMVRVRGDVLEVKNGKRWLDYNHTRLSAQ